MRKITFFILWVAVSSQAFSASDLFSFSISYDWKNSQEIAKSDTRINTITRGNFLIVGSFKNLANAQRFTKYLINKSISAELGYYKGTGNYYVYIYTSPDVTEVRNKRDQVRLSAEFQDAWVMKVGESFASRINANGSEVVISGNRTLEIAPKPNEAEPVAAETKTVESANKNVKQYKVYLNTVEATSYKEVPARIKMVKGDEGKLIADFESHRTQLIEIPIGEKQEAQLICEIFGYKKIEQEINFLQPLNDQSKTYTHLAQDTIVVDFELVRYKKGEVFTMFNVFFYNDAAVMLPKSTYELNQLVDLVKENENLIIKLHGHTNGNQFGKIIKLADDDNEYFNLKPSNIHTKGSAKDLSHERASIIRKYLIEQGIEERRIEVKGWGGSKMLYPIKSPDAKKNVRVEIEILRD